MTQQKHNPSVNINPDDDLKTNNEDITNPAGIPNNTGPDTTGVGQPTSQAINQGNSLPAIAKPVERKFIDQPTDFYDPEKAKELGEANQHSVTGGAKTPDL